MFPLTSVSSAVRVQDLIEIQWLPPAFNGGAAISSYRLDMARVGAAAGPPNAPGHLPSPADKVCACSRGTTPSLWHLRLGFRAKLS